MGLAARKPLTFPVRRPYHHHRRPPMAAHLPTSTHTPHRQCTSMHRPHRWATGRQQSQSRRRSTTHLFTGRGRADTERTGLMRGEATLFTGVAGGTTAGDFGLSRPVVPMIGNPPRPWAARRWRPIFVRRQEHKEDKRQCGLSAPVRNICIFNRLLSTVGSRKGHDCR